MILGYLNAGSATLIVVTIYVIFGVGIGGGVGYLLGKARGRAAIGFVLGAILGFVGWIIVVLLGRTPEADTHRNLEAAGAERQLSGDVARSD